MTIEELTKAFWMLNGKWNPANLTVEKVTEDGLIYMSNGTYRQVTELVKEYNKFYGDE